MEESKLRLDITTRISASQGRTFDKWNPFSAKTRPARRTFLTAETFFTRLCYIDTSRETWCSAIRQKSAKRRLSGRGWRPTRSSRLPAHLCAWMTGTGRMSANARRSWNQPMRAIEIDRRRVSALLLLLSAWVGLSSALAQTPPTHKDIVYATVDGKDLALDLYMPAGVRTPALVVWVHGGAWRSGTKARPPMAFVENGFASASLDFRQSGEARFPAQCMTSRPRFGFSARKRATTVTAPIASRSPARRRAVTSPRSSA